MNYFRNLGWEFFILDLYLQGMNLPPLHSSHTNSHIVYEASLLVFVFVSFTFAPLFPELTPALYALKEPSYWSFLQ